MIFYLPLWIKFLISSSKRRRECILSLSVIYTMQFTLALARSRYLLLLYPFLCSKCGKYSRHFLIYRRLDICLRYDTTLQICLSTLLILESWNLLALTIFLILNISYQKLVLLSLINKLSNQLIILLKFFVNSLNVLFKTGDSRLIWLYSVQIVAF